ncbi:hypothetical protein, partial [Mycobacterium sp. E2238]|uniref:hypothetical protein n=1 Tax=Mycobacterium sp. E2238 TaxID=1834131 RepID=UPI001E36A1E8
VTWLIESLDAGLPKGQVWTQCHSAAFDFSVWEIFGALLRGRRLLVVPESVAGSPEELHDLLAAEWHCVHTCPFGRPASSDSISHVTLR